MRNQLDSILCHPPPNHLIHLIIRKKSISMSVGTTVPFINDFLVINGDSATTIGEPVPEDRTKVVVLEFWAT